jgi:hypothetical protein
MPYYSPDQPRVNSGHSSRRRRAPSYSESQQSYGYGGGGSSLTSGSPSIHGDSHQPWQHRSHSEVAQRTGHVSQSGYSANDSGYGSQYRQRTRYNPENYAGTDGVEDDDEPPEDLTYCNDAHIEYLDVQRMKERRDSNGVRRRSMHAQVLERAATRSLETRAQLNDPRQSTHHSSRGNNRDHGWQESTDHSSQGAHSHRGYPQQSRTTTYYVDNDPNRQGQYEPQFYFPSPPT